MLFGRGPPDTMGVRDDRRLCTWWNVSVSVMACGLWCMPMRALLACDKHMWSVWRTGR